MLMCVAALLRRNTKVLKTIQIKGFYLAFVRSANLAARFIVKNFIKFFETKDDFVTLIWKPL